MGGEKYMENQSYATVMVACIESGAISIGQKN